MQSTATRKGEDETMGMKIDIDRIIEAIAEDDYRGFCTACGEEAYGVEPDARGYTCEACGEPKVYGAEELLIMIVP